MRTCASATSGGVPSGKGLRHEEEEGSVQRIRTCLGLGQQFHNYNIQKIIKRSLKDDE